MTAIVGLIILGVGGHARSAADVALALGIRKLIFVDEGACADEMLYGFPARKAFDEPLPDGWQAFAASGDSLRRQAQVADILHRSWPLATLIAPTASLGVEACVSAGSFVGHHAHVGPSSRIGTACILNTGSVVDHECEVGEYTHLSVNASVAGRSRIGRCVWLGVGASVVDNVSVSDGITVGAGGVVIGSLAEPGIYGGVPVRLIKEQA
jgi:UDP-N-acetylbacillosamine N-acetyltransferase